jgi:uncharacterized damage-inducible protein DinB
MTHKQALLAAFDDALHYKWESLSAALDGVTEKNAVMPDPGYFDEPSRPNYPPAGTIMWQLYHLTWCYCHYTKRILSRPESTEVDPPQSSDSFEDARELMLRTRESLREAIDSLSESDLFEPIAEAQSVAEYIRMITRHDAWHAAQIVMTRRHTRPTPF